MIALALWPDAIVFGAVGGAVGGVVFGVFETIRTRRTGRRNA